MSAMSFGEAERRAARRLIDIALEEDHARQDLTSALAVRPEARAEARIRNREWGCLSGIDCVELTLQAMEADARVVDRVEDGETYEAGTTLLHLEGCLSDVLAARDRALR